VKTANAKRRYGQKRHRVNGPSAFNHEEKTYTEHRFNLLTVIHSDRADIDDADLVHLVRTFVQMQIRPFQNMLVSYKPKKT
jgi:hypothetical protein